MLIQCSFPLFRYAQWWYTAPAAIILLYCLKATTSAPSSSKPTLYHLSFGRLNLPSTPEGLDEKTRKERLAKLDDRPSNEGPPPKIDRSLITFPPTKSSRLRLSETKPEDLKEGVSDAIQQPIAADQMPSDGSTATTNPNPTPTPVQPINYHHLLCVSGEKAWQVFLNSFTADPATALGPLLKNEQWEPPSTASKITHTVSLSCTPTYCVTPTGNSYSLAHISPPTQHASTIIEAARQKLRPDTVPSSTSCHTKAT